MNCKEETYMEKSKSMLALMIAMVIMCISTFSVFAMDTELEDNLYDEIEELHNLCMMSVNVFGAIAKDGSYSHKPGVIYLSISNLNDINTALDNATDIIHRYGYPMTFENYNGITEEEIKDAYDNLQGAMDRATIEANELKVLADFCHTEKNDDGYYPDEVWAEFENSTSRAQNTLEDMNADGEDYNRAYWGMLYNYNKLCLVNRQYGDVDFNGDINILDATKLQRILARLEDSNSSILQICKLEITYATEIQRYLALLVDVDNLAVYPERFDYLSNNVECSNYNSQEWYFNSWRMNYLFMDYLGSYC